MHRIIENSVRYLESGMGALDYHLLSSYEPSGSLSGDNSMLATDPDPMLFSSESEFG